MKSEIDYAEVRSRIANLIGEEKPYPWARRMGLSSATWSRFWSKHETPKLETLHRIAVGSGVTLDWLIYGRSAPGISHPKREVEANVIAVPVLAVRGSAGPGTAAGEEEVPTRFVEVARSLLSDKGLQPAHTSALTIQGDSAEPTLSDGELVLVDRSQTHPQDGGMYVISVGDDIVVKRIQRLIEGGLLLKSDNPTYETQRVSAADAEAVSLRIIGRVRYALRSI